MIKNMSTLRDEKIKALEKYFEERPSILMAFVFGSRSKGLERETSDWDIGVYFRPEEHLELETENEYPEERRIWSDVVDILETDNVDFVVLNRAKPSLVYNVLRTGLTLKMEDKKFYFDLLCKASYEAMDWWAFVDDYRKIKKKSASISKESKNRITERLDFLETELKALDRFKKMDWEEYSTDRDKRRNVERWVENLVMSSLDIAKIVLASEGRNIPQTYKKVLKVFVALYVDKSIADDFSQFADLRNIITHEYLDMKWKRIKAFIKTAEKLYPRFIKTVEKIVQHGV